MKKLFVGLLKSLTTFLEGNQENGQQKSISQKKQPESENIVTPSNQDLWSENLESSSKLPQDDTTPTEANSTPKISSKNKKERKKEEKPSRSKIVRGPTVFVKDYRDIRDIMKLMEFPFVALSKKRTEPIIYESLDGKSRIKISAHREHYLASIYDWDIILFAASKIQETINSGEDVPPRTIKVPRNELLRAIYKHDGKKNRKQMEASLSRLQLTGIETTIHNEDYRYRAGFGFLDSWGYTERKDLKEFRITLSDWLYDITCKKGSLLKIEPEYFKITSGMQKFLYRTARKHVGIQNESWTFSIENLYEKSGSEQEFKKFKHDLKKVVEENNLIGYFLEWIEEGEKTFVRFISHKKAVKKMLLEPQPSTYPSQLIKIKKTNT